MKKLVMILLLFTSQADATTVLTYTGNDFTNINDSSNVEGSYTNSMKITATLELSSPLEPNFDGSIFPLHSIFSDDRQIITDALVPCTTRNKLPCGLFYFKTNNLGDIINWEIEASLHPTYEDVTFNSIYSVNKSFAVDSVFIRDPITFNSDNAHVSNLPGVWVDPEPTPEPSTLLLMSGFIGLYFLLGRKK